ncbi:hypothetical protein [Pendulispora albinea]|uniref:Uncharacterized protein n=1 Tax=Pendulispora albinea TaxID=2741071 RepID=A0ABZ2LT52_9BACT
MPKDKKKKSALAAAASRRLASIGAPQMSPEQLAHALLHAEERGEAQRVPLEDGTWAWAMQDGNGQTRLLKPTPPMLEALDRFEREGHPAH